MCSYERFRVKPWKCIMVLKHRVLSIERVSTLASLWTQSSNEVQLAFLQRDHRYGLPGGWSDKFSIRRGCMMNDISMRYSSNPVVACDFRRVPVCWPSTASPSGSGPSDLSWYGRRAPHTERCDRFCSIEAITRGQPDSASSPVQIISNMIKMLAYDTVTADVASFGQAVSFWRITRTSEVKLYGGFPSDLYCQNDE